MHIRLYLFLLIYIFCTGLSYSQRKSITKQQQPVVIPDTVLIRTDRGNIITSRFYVVNAKDLIRIDYKADTEKSDTTFFEGLNEDDLRLYNSAIYSIKLRQKPIEQINDQEAFYYFEIGDSLEYFLSKLGSKKVYVSYTGYQLSFPEELTGKPQIIEYKFWDDGILHGIERITKVNTLPTNDVWTAFQLIEIKESLNDLEQAVNLLRSKNRKHSNTNRKRSNSKRK